MAGLREPRKGQTGMTRSVCALRGWMPPVAG